MKLNSSMKYGIIDQFRYFKIQPNTIDLSTKLWGIDPTNTRTEVYCFGLNFNISKLVYCPYAVAYDRNTCVRRVRVAFVYTKDIQNTK